MRDNEKNKTLIKNDISMLSPKKLVELMDKHVVGQDQAKKVLAVGIYNHMKRIANTFYPEYEPIQKSNILMIGPTGSGKTYLIESICKELDIPFGIADATGLTQSGTWGEDSENILFPLLEYTNMDKEMAARGIIYIDEIDKLAYKEGVSIHISTGVQRSLLKIIEGKIVNVMPESSRAGSGKHGDTVPVDSTNILFIVGGAFAGLEKILESTHGARTIGFHADHCKPKKQKPEPKDIVQYGLMTEFVGRLHTIVELNPLSVDDLVSILTEPQNCLVDQYKRLFWHDTIVLEFEQSALETIAEHALKLKTGARGLRSIMERVMTDIMFIAPSEDKVLITVTKKMVEDQLC